jgi:hypothetical protein
VNKFFNIRKAMRAKVMFQVLDEPIRPVEATGLTAQTSLTSPETGLTSESADNTNSAARDDSIIKAEDQNWRVPLIFYLKNSGRGAEKNTWRMAFK